jgi:RimJ/RimL family protein N-acetyltransferase
MDDINDAFARVEWPVRTERLTLRPATANDAETTWQWRRLPEVNHWITAAPDHDEYVRLHDEPARLARTLIVERDGRPIGDLMIRVEDAWSQAEVADRARGVQAELGWTFDPAAQGQGYATEAVRAAIAVCFGQLGLRRVVANCFAGNEASWRLMERLGMRREAYTVAESLHRNGEWQDSISYALLADEWHG